MLLDYATWTKVECKDQGQLADAIAQLNDGNQGEANGLMISVPGFEPVLYLKGWLMYVDTNRQGELQAIKVISPAGNETFCYNRSKE